MASAKQKLKKQNKKHELKATAKVETAAAKMEDQVFDVKQDPADGNYYLHINPEDLDKYTPKELQKMQNQFAKHIAN